MSINLGSISEERIIKLFDGGLSKPFKTFINTANSGEDRLVINQHSLDPNGLYSRIELTLNKNGKLEKNVQQFLDDPSKDYIKARPFGYMHTEII